MAARGGGGAQGARRRQRAAVRGRGRHGLRRSWRWFGGGGLPWVPQCHAGQEDGAPKGPSCSNKAKRQTTMSGKIAGFSSKRTLNRDLPDQLEAHAHRLLKDAGWSIKPRVRNDRTKMAYYFAVTVPEVVVSSLSQAWKFCGQRLHRVSGGSEWGKFPMEWSDVDQFLMDLVNTMDGVGKTTVDGEDSLTLLQRWQLLDPFVSVVFIDKRIIALQKQKTLIAVDSSASVIDYGNNRPSEDEPTPLRPCSGYSQVEMYKIVTI
uniref:Uncharacterized protein n=1 Tax=Arundo donax TaxID=35708 RepID=A0A0A9F2B1_ARUDO